MLDERATSRSNGQISRHTQRSEIRGCAHGGDDYDVFGTTDSCLFFMKQAVGVDNIVAELLKTLPWRTVQAITRAFTRRYLGEPLGNRVIGEKNVIVPLPRKSKSISHLAGQTRGLFVQSTRAKWYGRCLAVLLNFLLNAPCSNRLGIDESAQRSMRREGRHASIPQVHLSGRLTGSFM